MQIGPEFEREMKQWRGHLPTTPSEKLIEIFEGTTWCMGQLEALIGVKPEGCRLPDPTFGEQYRLLAFAAKQELLKRLGV